MNSALYSLILLANPTIIIYENRIVLRVLTMLLLLLSRKDWRGKCESAVEATPLLWQPVTVGCECGLGAAVSVAMATPRRPPPAARNSRKSTLLVSPPHYEHSCFVRGFAHALLITTQSDDSFVLFTYSNVNINPRPRHPTASDPLVYSTRPSLNRGKSLIGH